MKKYKKAYVSGMVTGLSSEIVKSNFKKACEEALEFAEESINIYELIPYHPDKTWKDYMLEDMPSLFDSDVIYMLNNWGNSKGARVERAIAMELGIDIIYQPIINQ